MLKGMVLAVVTFALFFTVHVVLFRIRVPQKRFITNARIASALGLGMIMVHRATPPDLGILPSVYTAAGWAIDLLNGLIVYMFLFIGYSMFYFLVDRGFSGRIMIEIEHSPQRRLRPPEIMARYPLETILQRRLNEMISIGRIEERQGRYRNTAKGRSAAAAFGFVKRFLQLGEGG
jgi:hypothetical protein